jgi:hypothetical protein
MSSFLVDSSTKVDNDSYEPLVDEDVAILFTDDDPPPRSWSIIQRRLERPDIAFFRSSDRELLKRLGQTAFPGLYAVRDGRVTRFKKKLSATGAIAFLQSTLKERPDF